MSNGVLTSAVIEAPSVINVRDWASVMKAEIVAASSVGTTSGTWKLRLYLFDVKYQEDTCPLIPVTSTFHMPGVGSFIIQITAFGVSTTVEEDLSPVDASNPSGFFNLKEPALLSRKNKAITYSVPGRTSMSDISRSLKVSFFSPEEINVPLLSLYSRWSVNNLRPEMLLSSNMFPPVELANVLDT